jgi:endonuclease/exonuclease/phosphatase (EEP) superfamily protein YafD
VPAQDASPAPPSPAAEPVRRLASGAFTALCWLLAVALAVFGLTRLTGLQSGVLLVQLTSFTPYVAAGALAVAALAALGRRLVPAALAGVAAAVLIACVAPRALASPESGDAGVPLVVMSVNLRLGGADPQAVVDLVRAEHVDVLALQELTPESEQALLALGLGEELPYRESHPHVGASGTALFARGALTDGGSRIVSDEGHDQAYATLTMPGAAPVTLESVHPVPPLSNDLLPYWRVALGNQLPATTPGPPRILVGDFNATLDHAELRRLLATGYRDAADEVGAGLTPTWPFYGLRAAVTPKIAIDHVLVPAGVGVRDFRAVTIPYTDHRAVIVTLRLPRA